MLVFKRTATTLIVVFGVLILIAGIQAVTVIRTYNISTTNITANLTGNTWVKGTLTVTGASSYKNNLTIPSGYFYKGDGSYLTNTSAYVVVAKDGSGDYNCYGGADCSAQLQNAINQNKSISIKAGNFSFSKTLNITHSQVILCAGEDNTVLNYNGANDAIRIGTGTRTLGGVAIKNCRINITSNARRGISIVGGMNGDYENLFIRSTVAGTGPELLYISGNDGTAVGAWFNNFKGIKLWYGDVGLNLTGKHGDGQANVNNFFGVDIRYVNTGIHVDEGYGNLLMGVDIESVTATTGDGIWINDNWNRISMVSIENAGGSNGDTGVILTTNAVRNYLDNIFVQNFNTAKITNSGTSNFIINPLGMQNTIGNNTAIIGWLTTTGNINSSGVISQGNLKMMNTNELRQGNNDHLYLGYQNGKSIIMSLIGVGTKWSLNSAGDVSQTGNLTVSGDQINLVANNTIVCKAGVYALFRHSQNSRLCYCENGVIKDLY